MANYNKMRIIALYIMSKNGISEENLNKLVTHAQLDPADKQTLLNLNNLGLNVVVDVRITFCHSTRNTIRLGTSFPLAALPAWS